MGDEFLHGNASHDFRPLDGGGPIPRFQTRSLPPSAASSRLSGDNLDLRDDGIFRGAFDDGFHGGISDTHRPWDRLRDPVSEPNRRGVSTRRIDSHGGDRYRDPHSTRGPDRPRHNWSGLLLPFFVFRPHDQRLWTPLLDRHNHVLHLFSLCGGYNTLPDREGTKQQERPKRQWGD